MLLNMLNLKTDNRKYQSKVLSESVTFKFSFRRSKLQEGFRTYMYPE